MARSKFYTADFTRAAYVRIYILNLCVIIPVGGETVYSQITYNGHPCKEPVDNIKNIEYFLLDMDGTIYLGETLLDGTLDFLDTVKKQNKKVMYITNNSSKATRQYVEKLKRLGIESEEKDFFTSVNALEYNLRKTKPGARLFVLGTPAFEQYLENCGFELIKGYYPEPDKRPDFVILAYDTTLTYDKLVIACDYLTDGVEYWATHPDMVCPIREGRSVPDAGSFMECIYAATGRRPSFVAGKPNPCMVQLLIDKYGLSPERVAVVGDRLNTDIMAAVNAGVKSICVLTGEASAEDVDNTPESDRPTFVLDSIRDVWKILESR